MTVRIGITAGEIDNQKDPWSPKTYGQTHTYVDAVINAGGIPLILPLTDNEAVLQEMYGTVDGILFAGGNDIDPALYREKPLDDKNSVSRLRDEYEAKLMRWALEDNKPILAICRGMQLLNVVMGGSLYQDIVTQLPSATDHKASTRAKDRTFIAHRLEVEPSSQFAKIIGNASLPTNSHHHQAIKELAPSLAAVAWADDEVIEAVEMPDKKFVIGVQSHPEALESHAERRWQKLFASFVEACPVIYKGQVVK